MGTDDHSRIPLQLSRGCVVASIQVDLDEDLLVRFREELLNFVHSSGARGVILDLSGVDVMDSEDFQALRSTIDMAQLMGAKAVMSGLGAGVVSALIDLGADTHGIDATLTLDDAFDLFLTTRTVEEVEDSEGLPEPVPGDFDPDSPLGDVGEGPPETESHLDGP